MKRIIKDYNSVEEHHLSMIEDQYPDGFDQESLISIPDQSGKLKKYLEVKGEEVVYLLRISEQMIGIIDDFTDDDFVVGEMEDYYNDEY